MSEPVFMFDAGDPMMSRACEAAQRSFKYFWRELSWERRRIVPGLDMSAVKAPFTDGPRTDGRPEFEHMWMGEVGYDGEMVSGRLLNSPNWLTSVQEGDAVRVPFSRVTDWMMAVDRQVYGGFTVNVMRATMSSAERKQHDTAWGLDFGDPATVRLEVEREKKPKGGLLSALFAGRPKNSNQEDSFRDHPMCLNMLEKYQAQLKAEPTMVHTVDDAGWTLLHREALAGNLGVVKILVGCGAQVATKTRSGQTASDLARSIGWPEIARYLDDRPKA